MMPDSYIDPSRAAFDLFKSLPRDVPINMLNLLKFNAIANYSADHPMPDINGAVSGPIRNMARPAGQYSRE